MFLSIPLIDNIILNESFISFKKSSSCFLSQYIFFLVTFEVFVYISVTVFIKDLLSFDIIVLTFVLIYKVLYLC